VLSVSALFFDRRLECMCVRCVYTHAHTHSARGVLDASPGVGLTSEEVEESRSTKALHACRPVSVYKVHVCIYMQGCNDLG